MFTVRQPTGSKIIASAMLEMSCAAAWAASAKDGQPKAATEGSTVPYRFPPIDPAKELTGAAFRAAPSNGVSPRIEIPFLIHIKR